MNDNTYTMTEAHPSRKQVYRTPNDKIIKLQKQIFTAHLWSSKIGRYFYQINMLFWYAVFRHTLPERVWLFTVDVGFPQGRKMRKPLGIDFIQEQ